MGITPHLSGVGTHKTLCEMDAGEHTTDKLYNALTTGKKKIADLPYIDIHIRDVDAPHVPIHTASTP